MTEKEYRTKFARLGGIAKAKKMTLQQRKAHSRIMILAKLSKQNKAKLDK